MFNNKFKFNICQDSLFSRKHSLPQYKFIFLLLSSFLFLFRNFLILFLISTIFFYNWLFFLPLISTKILIHIQIWICLTTSFILFCSNDSLSNSRFKSFFFDGNLTDATLQFFDWIKTFISDFNKRRSRCFKIVFRCPVFIAFAWLYFLTIFNINNISKFFIFIQYSILNSFFSVVSSNGLCSGKSLLIFTSKNYMLPICVFSYFRLYY